MVIEIAVFTAVPTLRSVAILRAGRPGRPHAGDAAQKLVGAVAAILIELDDVILIGIAWVVVEGTAQRAQGAMRGEGGRRTSSLVIIAESLCIAAADGQRHNISGIGQVCHCGSRGIPAVVNGLYEAAHCRGPAIDHETDIGVDACGAGDLVQGAHEDGEDAHAVGMVAAGMLRGLDAALPVVLDGV
jgi:hypothetical protein